MHSRVKVLPKQEYGEWITDTMAMVVPVPVDPTPADIVKGFNKGLMLLFEGLVSDEEIGWSAAGNTNNTAQGFLNCSHSRRRAVPSAFVSAFFQR